MKFFKNNLLIFILLCSFSGFSQEKEPIKKDIILPESIYAFPIFSTDINSTYHLNQRLNLTSYQFLRFNQSTFEEGYFAVPLYNITRSPSDFIYDSYIQNYETSVLQSAFFKVSDLYKVRTKNEY